jgi:hypothetical protein
MDLHDIAAACPLVALAQLRRGNSWRNLMQRKKYPSPAQ